MCTGKNPTHEHIIPPSSDSFATSYPSATTTSGFNLYICTYSCSPSETPAAPTPTCPLVTQGHFPVPSRRQPFAAGNSRALQPKPSVTDVGFATLTSLQGIPLPPSSSGILSLHAIPFATSKQGQAPAGCCTSLSLGHLASIFPLLNNLLEQTKNKAKKLA